MNRASSEWVRYLKYIVITNKSSCKIVGYYKSDLKDICVYVYIYLCIFVYVYICMCIYLYLCVCVCICMCVCNGLFKQLNI